MFTIKKSLGQHFLHDENVCRKIIAELQQHPLHQLLEVGPGTGALTKYLLQIENIDLKAVEIDKEKIQFLLNKFPSLLNKLIENDFLEMEKPFDGKFTVVGNFPYNISSQIVFKVMDWKEDVECMVGMFQKEVALRIAAKHGNKIYGVISVLVQAFFDVEYLFEVSERSFAPPPKVKSAVIRLRQRTEDLKFKEEKKFFLLVKTAFNQRRKTLRNSVKSLFDETILQDEIFNKRAEQLSVEDFAMLTFKMR
jgi:16S rRNA (adenine1518-N6/adenine1519-N6)-dimethyltransferase